jgi:hypothetical protein
MIGSMKESVIGSRLYMKMVRKDLGKVISIRKGSALVNLDRTHIAHHNEAEINLAVIKEHI